MDDRKPLLVLFRGQPPIESPMEPLRGLLEGGFLQDPEVKFVQPSAHGSDVWLAVVMSARRWDHHQSIVLTTLREQGVFKAYRKKTPQEVHFDGQVCRGQFYPWVEMEVREAPAR